MAKKKLPAGIRLKRLRERRGMSQAHFGKLVGASASRVSEWESERHKPEAGNRIAVAAQTRIMGDEIRVEDW